MIEVRNLSKSYGDRLAIDRLNFSVSQGEVVGFLGPNGAGKSTTMKIITGYMAPSEGSVRVAGFDVFEEPIEVKKRIGYLPETPPVYGDMRVNDYLTYVAALRLVEKTRIKSLVEAAIEKTNLGDVRNRLIQNLSKGFKQRVGLAQALVSDPEVLILDEPTVGLDPRQVSEMRRLIQQLRGHHTIILSTHILPEVQANCERVIIINNGQIVVQDSLLGLTQKMAARRHLKVRVKRAQSDVVTALKTLPGVIGVEVQSNGLAVDIDDKEDTIEAISAMVVQKGAGLLELAVENMNLEDIFIQLTSNQNGRENEVSL